MVPVYRWNVAVVHQTLEATGGRSERRSYVIVKAVTVHIEYNCKDSGTKFTSYAALPCG